MVLVLNLTEVVVLVVGVSKPLADSLREDCTVFSCNSFCIGGNTNHSNHDVINYPIKAMP